MVDGRVFLISSFGSFLRSFLLLQFYAAFFTDGSHNHEIKYAAHESLDAFFKRVNTWLMLSELSGIVTQY